MATDIGGVEGRLRLTDDFSGPLRNAAGQLAGFKQQFLSLAADIGIVVGSVEGFKTAINEAAHMENVVALLDNTFRHAAATVGLTRGAMDDLAESINRTSTFSVESAKSAETLLLAFHNIRGDVFKEAMQASADFAAKLGTDIPSAARMLGRALEQPEVGFQMLRRVGVIFNESQKETIRLMANTGQVAQAQELILKKLFDTIGGNAAALRDTLGGSISAMRTAIEEFEQTVGETLAPGVRKIAEELAAWLDANHALAAQMGGDFTRSLEAASSVLKVLLDHFIEVKVLVEALVVLKISSWFRALAASTEAAVLAANPWLLVIAAILVGMKLFTDHTNAAWDATMAGIKPMQDIKAAMEGLDAAAKSTDPAVWAKSLEEGEKAINTALDEQKRLLAEIVKVKAEIAKGPEKPKTQYKAVEGSGAEALLQMFGFGPDDVRTLKEQLQDLQNMYNWFTVQSHKLQTKQAEAKEKAPPMTPEERERSEAQVKWAHDLVELSGAAQQAAENQALLTQAVRDGAQAEIDARNAIELHKVGIDVLNKMVADGVLGRRESSQSIDEWVASVRASKPDIDSIITGLEEWKQKEQDLAQEQRDAAAERQQNQANFAAYAAAAASDAAQQALASGVQIDAARQVGAIRSEEARRAVIGLMDETLWTTKLAQAQLNAETTARQDAAAEAFLTTKLQEARQATVDLQNAAAEYKDTLAQTDAEAKYGSAIAGILTQYGLLSAATKEATIQQRAYDTAVKEAAYNASQETDPEKAKAAASPEAVAALKLKWAEVYREQQAGIDAIKKQGAAAALARNVVSSIREEWARTKDVILSTIADVLTGAEVQWGDLFKGLLREWVLACEKMLVQWVLTQSAMKAFQVGLNASSAAGGGTNLNSFSGLMKGASTAYAAYSGYTAAGTYSAATGGAAAYGGNLGGIATMGSSAYSSYLAYIGGSLAVVGLVVAAANYIKTHRSTLAEIGITGGTSGFTTIATGQDYRDSGRLAQVTEVAKAYLKNLNDFVKAMGGLVTGFEGTLTIGRRGQGSNTDWRVVAGFAGQMAKSFGTDMQAAYEYAMIQALKQSQMVGLSPEVAAAIKNTTAEKLDDLQKDLALAAEAVKARIGETGIAVLDIVQRYDAEIQALQKLGIATDAVVAARNRELQGLRNQVLGIDSSSAARLAALKSFNDGVDEAIRSLQEKAAVLRQQLAGAPVLTQVGRGAKATWVDASGTEYSAGDAAKWAEARRQLKEYEDQLAALPKKLSQQEIEMGIFDTLYQYLKGSSKYAQQAHEYAVLKVRLEFEAIKAQLIALGEWEKFAGMWNDALNAAIKIAGRGPGGGGRAQAAADFEQWLSDMRSRTLGPFQQALHDLNSEFDRERETLKHNTAAIARLEEERRREIALLHEQQREQVRGDVLRFLTAGNPYMQTILGIQQQARELQKEIQDAFDAGSIGATEFANKMAWVAAQAQNLQFQSLQTGIQSIILSLYDFLGKTKEAEAMKHAIAVAQILAAQAQLAAAIASANITDAQRAQLQSLMATLGPLISQAIANPRFGIDSTINQGGGIQETVAQVDNALQQLIDAFHKAKDDIRSFLADLARGSEGIVTPRAALAAAQAQYQAMLKAAQGGDLTAIQAAPERARNLIEVLKAFSPALAAVELPKIMEELTGLLDVSTVKSGNLTYTERFVQAQTETNRVLNYGFDTLSTQGDQAIVVATDTKDAVQTSNVTLSDIAASQLRLESVLSRLASGDSGLKRPVLNEGSAPGGGLRKTGSA